ncbi:host specificity factor TipJ family phage tail protein [Pseudomonas sp.]|uniref:host specificity factor TipJ family phage tail protein n=1 Tax=Pseudomonas sp. TaxID=306 RepID=UPI002585D50F|nr:host specificity factor TipJ family phage tail protein [Pseudomonas sp.]
MKATLITCRDPLRPQLSREIVPLRRRRRLRALAPRTRQPHICLLNGRPVLRAEWGRKVRHGDVVAFVVLPQGGGGGSNPLRFILQIAILYVAVQFGGPLAASMGFTSTAAAAVSTAVIATAGNVLLNALIPLPRLGGNFAASEAASPTYSLTASGNQARIEQPIPVIYGRHLVYPDFAAQPYIEYGGNEQYLYQLHAVGQGYYDIEAIRIEDTPISSFEEIQYQVISPGGTVTLFPTQVVTSIEVSGQELTWNTTVTPNAGDVLGPFVANGAGTTANTLAIDIIATRGLYYANDDGSLSARSASWRVEAQRLDDAGTPITGWSTLGTETLSAATTTPQRQTYRYNVTPGRYQVRVVRTDAKLTDTRSANEIVWGSLRAYLIGSNSYGQITMLALRMRASNNLSQLASRKINVICTRKLPIWNGSSWSTPTATASPAWALADIARASYGAGLPDSRIDLAGLKSLADQWAARGDECNLIMDQQSTIWEALRVVARTGRAFPFLQGGVLRVYRDAPQALPAAMFSPRTMVKQSLALTYKMPSTETADAVDVEYFDRLVWKWRTVRAQLPDSIAAVPVKLKLPGITDRAQAWREGMYMAACNRFRRRFVSFSTEMDGLIPSLGDTVVVAHDMPQWGQSSEAVAFDPATRTLTLADAVTFTTGTHYLSWRGRDGRPVGPFQVAPGAAANVVVLQDWDLLLNGAPDTGYDRERSHVAFGPAAAQYVTAKVLSITPRSQSSVELSLVVDSDYVYQADTGATPGASAWQLPLTATAPSLRGLIARSQPGNVDQMVISWAPSPGAERYLVELSADGNSWTRVSETTATSYLGRAVYGVATQIRVAAVGITRGPWTTVYYGSSAGYMWSANAATAMWTLNTNKMWSA